VEHQFCYEVQGSLPEDREFLKGLGFSFSIEQVKTSFGEILNAKVWRDRDGTVRQTEYLHQQGR